MEKNDTLSPEVESNLKGVLLLLQQGMIALRECPALINASSTSSVSNGSGKEANTSTNLIEYHLTSQLLQVQQENMILRRQNERLKSLFQYPSKMGDKSARSSTFSPRKDIYRDISPKVDSRRRQSSFVDIAGEKIEIPNDIDELVLRIHSELQDMVANTHSLFSLFPLFPSSFFLSFFFFSIPFHLQMAFLPIP